MGSSVGLWRSALEFWKTLYSGVFVGVMSQPWILPEIRLGRAWSSGLNLFRDVGLQHQEPGLWYREGSPGHLAILLWTPGAGGLTGRNVMETSPPGKHRATLIHSEARLCCCCGFEPWLWAAHDQTARAGWCVGQRDGLHTRVQILQVCDDKSAET